MADEKKPEAKAYGGPQWGRAVRSFKCLTTASYSVPGGQSMLQSGKVDRDGVTAMELHPLGVLVTYKTVLGGQAPQKLIPAGGLTDIDLA